MATTTNAETTEKVDNTKSTENPLDNRIKRLTNAHKSVKNYTMGAVTVGFIPVPLIDIAVLTTLQLKMLHSLARCYEVPFTKNLVKSILSSLLGGTAAITVAMPVGSLLKALPVIGQTSGLISTATIGSAATYAVGKIFIAHFESNGTFLNFDSEKAKEHFKELYEEGKDFVISEKATKAKT